MRLHMPTFVDISLVTLARIAAVVIVLVFAHDVMMTVHPQHAIAESAHHEIVEVQECGSSEGIATQQSGSPVDALTAHLIPAGLYYADSGSANTSLVPVFVEPDASTRRAWLQVFLN